LKRANGKEEKRTKGEVGRERERERERERDQSPKATLCSLVHRT
jgi:hypothetical protein